MKWPSSRSKLGKRLVGNQQTCAMAGGLYQDVNEEIRSDTTVPPTTKAATRPELEVKTKTQERFKKLAQKLEGLFPSFLSMNLDELVHYLCGSEKCKFPYRLPGRASSCA